MDVLVGKVWLLLFCLLILVPMLYSAVKTEKRILSIQPMTIIVVITTQIAWFFVFIAGLAKIYFLNIFVLMLFWQLLILFSIVMVFYLVLNELKEKYLRNEFRYEWTYLVPAIFEASLLVFFNLSSYTTSDVGLIVSATSVSLYFVVNFYILIGAWRCYKTYLYTLDFDIKYIARKHFFFYLILCIALFIQQTVFKSISFSSSLSIFLLFNFMTRSKTLISQDALSGVNNRISFNKYINNVFINREHGEAFIVFIDIDKFKMINDTYGHIEGDEAIALVGKTLKSVAGETNSFVARIGGDEFVLVISTSDENRVKQIMQNITYELEERLIFSDKQYEITVSSGFVKVERNARNIRELIERADKRMYIEKQNKKAGAVNGAY